MCGEERDEGMGGLCDFSRGSKGGFGGIRTSDGPSLSSSSSSSSSSAAAAAAAAGGGAGCLSLVNTTPSSPSLPPSPPPPPRSLHPSIPPKTFTSLALLENTHTTTGPSLLLPRSCYPSLPTQDLAALPSRSTAAAATVGPPLLLPRSC